MTFHISPHSYQHKQWIFAFYGFGQHALVFDYFIQLTKKNYGCIVIDLPYHEACNEKTKEAFADKIKEIIQQNHIEKIIGISYSMGSKYNLVLAEDLAMYIDKIILIAPDGIKINFWAKLATSTIAGNFLFKFLMSHLHIYIKIITILYSSKLLSKTMYSFVKWHVRNKESAMNVYHSWTNMKNIVPDLKAINANQKKYQFDILAYFGKFDEVIHQNIAKKLVKEIPNTKIIELEKTHKLLDDNLFNHIASSL